MSNPFDPFAPQTRITSQSEMSATKERTRLRDYFAAHMPAPLMMVALDAIKEKKPWAEMSAELAYHWADAMLKERDK